MSSISVHLRQCRNLSSSRGDKFTCFARVEHGSRELGVGEKAECVSGEVLAVELVLGVPCGSEAELGEVAQNPLLVSFLEVLPKDKKAKEERTAVLGQACLDLLPLLQQQQQQQQGGKTQLSLRLETEDGITSSTAGDTESAAEVDVDVTLPASLLEASLSASNVLSLRLRSLHSLPDAWQPGAFPFTFTAALPLPLSPTNEQQQLATPPGVVVPNGVLKLGPDKDASCLSSHWKWPVLPSAVGKVGVVSDGPIEPRPLEDEVGEFNSKQDAKFRLKVECEQTRVSWNTQHRAWLSADVNSAFLGHLSRSSLWPVEIARFSMPGSAGKGKGKEEDPVISHHAVAYLNLAPLLYPGATHIAGAYQLHPYSHSEASGKTKHSLPPMFTTPATSPAAKKLGGVAGKKGPTSSSRLNDTSLAIGSDNEGAEGEIKTEALIFLESKTYVYLEIELHKPLIPKRPGSVLAEKISEYIPPRPALPRKVGGAEKAVLDFHGQTADIANILLNEYRAMFGLELAGGEGEEEEGLSPDSTERRSKLLFQLNSSGKYHAFKEQLKQSVVKIVREKYLNEAGSSDPAHRHAFLSKLYIFLTDEMHKGLGKLLSLEDPSAPPPSPVDCQLLKHFAVEAEMNMDFELAKKYYKERVTRSDHIAEYWSDYGVYSLLVGDLECSEQCFKEAVSLKQNMVPALLLYGMVLCLAERYSEAEVFFESATTCEPENIIAWTMRGLYYEHAGNGVYQEMCYKEAGQLNRDHTPKTLIIPAPAKATPPSTLKPQIASQSKASVVSKLAAGSTLLKGVDDQLVTSNKSLVGGGSSASKLANPDQEDSEATPPAAPPTLPPHKADESVVSLSNDRGSPTGGGGAERMSASQLQEISEESVPEPHSSGTTLPQGKAPSSSEAPPTSIFLQTAAYLLDVHALKFAEMALAHELTSPNGGASPSLSLAEARLHLHREQYHKALACLDTAIQMDLQDSNAWALKGHAHFLLGEFPEARDAYERAINYVKLPGCIHAVYLRLAEIYLQDREYVRARETLLHACRKSPSSLSWRGVGITCYQLGELKQAEDALCEANILNNLDPVIWAYLTLVCLQTDRIVEAEQAYKFAVKCGLSDSDLIGQIQALQTSQASQNPAN